MKYILFCFISFEFDSQNLLDKTTTTYMLYNCVLRQCLISTPLVLIPGISKGEQLRNISFSLPRNLTKVDDCY